jgi:hypothetical protein
MAQPTTAVDRSPKGETTVTTIARLNKLNHRLERAKTPKRALRADQALVTALREHPEEARIWLAVRGADLL